MIDSRVDWISAISLERIDWLQSPFDQRPSLKHHQQHHQMLEPIKFLFILTGASTYLGKHFAWSLIQLPACESITYTFGQCSGQCKPYFRSLFRSIRAIHFELPGLTWITWWTNTQLLAMIYHYVCLTRFVVYPIDVNGWKSVSKQTCNQADRPIDEDNLFGYFWMHFIDKSPLSSCVSMHTNSRRQICWAFLRLPWFGFIEFVLRSRDKTVLTVGHSMNICAWINSVCALVDKLVDKCCCFLFCLYIKLKLTITGYFRSRFIVVAMAGVEECEHCRQWFMTACLQPTLSPTLQYSQLACLHHPKCLPRQYSVTIAS